MVLIDLRTRYAVRIEFEDGEVYEAHATSDNSFAAFRQCLHVYGLKKIGKFRSPVKNWEAVIDELEVV